MPTCIMENPDSKIPPPPSALQTAPSLQPRHATLKDGSPVTLYPIANGAASIPRGLVELLDREFRAEVEHGCTYPMEEAMSTDKFAEYWFGTFAVVALVGAEESIREERDWEAECLGTFYIKPNYPGRCSHVCNAGFLTMTAARNRGVGIVMGEAYLEFAPKLGYKYSVFNLVFENNVASVKIWQRLGFEVIGRVPGAARLANSEELVDALIFGRKLGE
ncbi:GNAT family N-acetyltransferase [Aspergillus clavatus NRRL 1]|uniref:GNAT family acetyltransferase, putative n=1 Tax=Aspergillus clavatus (strain ATCC 1007 / CBS 513.65 / DSM 816 / NCTC 3887 / NRRL 1 / QM 1276 / 107) TaxID=344612 RepID=A1CEG5_ASPCL|nr:GNAT family acetyltransferase, putative [Aspergillus clavatus NRRL 1]EAW11264.1 GNAT family acetyltransferase, putative [Aspergillus clavatus NRRL 1]